ncbi:MAG: Outer membrane protein MIP [Chlamydiae bacterium]|nr:Outer membrane protein MIP [Chlamydiota bacterium]
MESQREKVSYCIGLQAGTSIKSQFKDIDQNLLERGFHHAIAEMTPDLESEEINKILKALQKQVEEQQKVFVEQMSDKNKEEGESFLKENLTKEGVEHLASGLQYKVIEEGSGPSPTMHDVVSVHYRGTFIDGRVFDSTHEREQPQEFPVGRVIPGWSEAIKLMKVGDKWEIYIPSYLAYGESGYGPQIEPNKTLIFEMELLKINS